MITARQYEEKMLEYLEEYKDKPETMRRLMEKLNIDTMDCLGYSAGARIYEDALQNIANPCRP